MRSGAARAPARLSLQEREEISRGVQAGESMRAIARRLGRSASTVSRDVAATGAGGSTGRGVPKKALSAGRVAPSTASLRAPPLPWTPSM
ncbi:helix-turn-helix domain-containing protein [Corallococcus exiguus]|uniref:helix-turn-helix domain-containing protein n=1 Tax=Corallococcus exiguus TaxID=83462 RepID=UPI00147093D6|nr:helix-turn-helix domain-containing protein [Corallococcus exiguus]NNB85290.1 helix-turn-helix domain-containing protein [Corallococcus exiguus]